jgi:hypothetical protein
VAELERAIPSAFLPHEGLSLMMMFANPCINHTHGRKKYWSSKTAENVVFEWVMGRDLLN